MRTRRNFRPGLDCPGLEDRIALSFIGTSPIPAAMPGMSFQLTDTANHTVAPLRTAVILNVGAPTAAMPRAAFGLTVDVTAPMPVLPSPGALLGSGLTGLGGTLGSSPSAGLGSTLNAGLGMTTGLGSMLGSNLGGTSSSLNAGPMDGQGMTSFNTGVGMGLGNTLSAGLGVTQNAAFGTPGLGSTLGMTTPLGSLGLGSTVSTTGSMLGLGVGNGGTTGLFGSTGVAGGTSLNDTFASATGPFGTVTLLPGMSTMLIA